MLNAIIKFSLRHRLLLVATFALLTAWGSRVLVNLPVDVFPDLNRPTVTIMTEAHGLAPEEVETLVTLPLQTAMNGLAGVMRVRSTSGIGLSVVWVEFGWNVDIYLARQQVSEKLSSILSQLPKDAVPQMSPITSLMGEIMLLGLSSDTLDAVELRSLADGLVKPRLQAIPGVAQLVSLGGGVKEIQILADLQKMREFQVSFDDLEKAATNIGTNTTGGFVDGTHQEFLIRNLSRPTSINDIAATPVVIRHSVPVRLDQVAQVSVGAQVKRGDAGINGKLSVIMSVKKQPDANTVRLTEEIEVALQELRKSLPKNVEFAVIFKQADFINTAIKNVEEALRDGSIFVAVVLFIFLLNFRTTAITLTAIPLSLLITAIILHAFHITINTMTLGGLAIAIGELVDDAIVDVENVFRRLRENRALENPQSTLRVVFAASSEVRNSIVIATIIVILVFVPLFFLDGLEGRMFIPLGIAYVVSILASLVVSLTITPVLCSYLLPQAKAIHSTQDGVLVRWMKARNQQVLNYCLEHPKLILSASGILVLVSTLALLFTGKEFLPKFDEGTITVFVTSPPGTSLSESNRIGKIAEKLIKSVAEVETVNRRTGRAEEDEHAEGVSNSEIDVNLRKSERPDQAVIAEIRNLVSQIPGVAVGVGSPMAHRIEHMQSGVEAQIALKIFGPDLVKLRALAQDLKLHIAEVPGLVDLQVERITTVPQIQIVADHQRLARFGMQGGDLSEKLEHILSGSVVGNMIEGTLKPKIVLRLKEDQKANIESIQKLLIDTPKGIKVPLATLAKVQLAQGPNAINHENGVRRIVVMANTSGRDLGSVVTDIQKIIAKEFSLPENYFLEIDGQFKNQINASRTIALLSILSLVGVFLVLYTYFSSAFLAMQVMLNVPLALVGSVVAVYLTGGIMSIGSLVGFITLCGIASRNGIMKITHYLHLMQHEHEAFTKEMVLRGSQERLVPVLMTAFTAMLALIPIALSGGDPGREILHPLAVVILGGLLSSTLLDLVVTPTVFFNYGKKSAERSLKIQEEKAENDLEEAA